ncbi:unnamed protein product, partial [Polarella glacialis]
ASKVDKIQLPTLPPRGASSSSNATSPSAEGDSSEAVATFSVPPRAVSARFGAYPIAPAPLATATPGQARSLPPARPAAKGAGRGGGSLRAPAGSKSTPRIPTAGSSVVAGAGRGGGSLRGPAGSKPIPRASTTSGVPVVPGAGRGGGSLQGPAGSKSTPRAQTAGVPVAPQSAAKFAPGRRPSRDSSSGPPPTAQTAGVSFAPGSRPSR